jgi:hypothetical protein
MIASGFTELSQSKKRPFLPLQRAYCRKSRFGSKKRVVWKWPDPHGWRDQGDSWQENVH